MYPVYEKLKKNDIQGIIFHELRKNTTERVTAEKRIPRALNLCKLDPKKLQLTNLSHKHYNLDFKTQIPK